ncbi:MAG: type I DNA topoisomerase [Gemmatimonadota bacterium]|nr:type I DNA topoisomerase [Gemmatimonadota bacterium]MDE3126881.1 type I DNA topoisomerase [Gemmatimonadota bacterium]MDE3172425.1 type I DNA topoisomerase [Gemmatimonadota bacterium]
MAVKKTRTTTKRAAAKARKPKGSAATKRRGRSAAAEELEDEADAGAGGETSLVIVESPAKAKTIGKYLGRGYRVRATVGHIMDLPQKKLGIDIENGFEPDLVPIPGKEKTIAELKSAAKSARQVLIATDPDREGEAIAWHVAEQLRPKRGKATIPVKRVLFHEITKDAVVRAVHAAGEIDERKVEAQQARRVLDRLVGYKASPVLWKTVKKGVSAGRVQTVALRLIVEREREIRAFNPVEYWTIEAALRKDGTPFTAKLHHVDGQKPEIHSKAEADRILADLAGRKTFGVTDVKRRERRKNPSAPFTTSTLQQEAAKKLSFGSKRTMRVAQDLYEGIELGAEGGVGLITYMRTDSTRVAEVAAGQARDVVRRVHGEEYLAAAPQLYGDGKNRAKNTQDAHEAVRPTDPSRRPEDVKKYLTADQFKLYQLVWQRFMASQMAPAVFDTTTVDFDIAAGAQPDIGRRNYLFRATGSIIKFPGFLALYRESHEEGDHKALEDEQALPPVERGEAVPVTSITPDQHFTEPPPRYSEASLVKDLEKLGIGRPSTYAAIISVLVDRHYVNLEQRRFFPTELGETVEKVMVKQFPDVFNVRFTSEMENELDKIEDGELGWRRVLEDFYAPFAKSLNAVDAPALIMAAHDLSGLASLRCPECGGRLEPRGGFFGPFLACENHPKTCKYTRPLKGEKAKPKMTDVPCPVCGKPMVVRSGRSGEFLGCSTFPKCRGTRSMPTGVICPKDGGEIVERRSKKRGTKFYACANETCDFVVWNKPVAEKCPECGYAGAEMKSTKARGDYRKCIKCGNEWDVAKIEEPEEALVG